MNNNDFVNKFGDAITYASTPDIQAELDSQTRFWGLNMPTAATMLLVPGMFAAAGGVVEALRQRDVASAVEWAGVLAVQFSVPIVTDKIEAYGDNRKQQVAELQAELDRRQDLLKAFE